MKKSVFGLIFCMMIPWFANTHLPFSHVITFFIQELPSDTATTEAEKLHSTLTTPGKTSAKMINSLTAFSYSGIFATYGGYLVASDYNGQITFPRMQQKAELSLIITERIEPVMMIGNTVHHWTLANNPYLIYSIERKQDHATKLYYWDVKQASEPKDRIIPLTSIVIFAKPRTIIVPLGITLTNDSQQFFLPTIYTTKNSNNVIPALAALKIRQFFGPITITNKKENDTYYATQMISTQ